MDPNAPVSTAVATRQPSPSTLPAPHAGRRGARWARVPRGLLIACTLLLVAAITPVFLMLSMGMPGQAMGSVSGLGTATTGASTATSKPTTGPKPKPTPRTGLPMLGGLQQVQDAEEEAYVNTLISKMSLDQELGQMIMLGFGGPDMNDSLSYMIQHYHLGSVILYANTGNIQSGPQVTALVKGLQSASPGIPLLIATDQEGGSVNRLVKVDGYTDALTSATGHDNSSGPAGATDMGATYSPQQIEARGEVDATYLAQVGVNLNLAPVVDVAPVPWGIGDLKGRVFGDTPQQVTTDAAAYLAGLQQSGKVFGTLKHFPGLGDVPTNPHNEGQLYHLPRSLTGLENIDWAPYRALLATGQVHAVMTTWVVDEAVDPTLPGGLSKSVVTGILRDQLGFNGVIITDGIYMGATWGIFPGGFGPVYLHAIEAGNDIICSLSSTDQMDLFFSTIKGAIANGTLKKAQIDASVRRILLLKMQLGLIHMPASH